ncbi:TetR/AcrR family transcriptional regulator [Lachnospiraceae bacterium OttesenSCG-928-D06]|nr:TetR/AcrR family transcriptional regulator [Lachnospiraceae bacterium OttesenSCG-928-D06]
MPKTYSDDERSYIKKRLKEEATYCLLNYGVKRTTVDDLIDRVKIPKGTFYLFYKTKELLLFEVLQDQHDMLEKQLLDEMRGLQGKVSVDGLTNILYRYYKSADDSGVLKLLTTGEIELLYRKLPQEIMQKHFGHDSDLVKDVMNILSLPGNDNIDALSTALRNLFIAMVYKREVGEKYFDEALKLTIKGLVIQLIQGK